MELIGAALILSIFLLLSVAMVLRYFKYKFRVEKFAEHIVLLHHHMEQAYSVVYNDRLFIYSLEATKVDDAEFALASKDFINLTVRMLGTVLYDYLVDFYGSADNLFFIIASYFNTKYEEDEIRRDAQNEFMDSEVDDQLSKQLGHS